MRHSSVGMHKCGEASQLIVGVGCSESLRVDRCEQLSDSVIHKPCLPIQGIGDLHLPPVIVAVLHGGMQFGVGDGHRETEFVYDQSHKILQ